MVKPQTNKIIGKEEPIMTGLIGFYLIGAMVLLMIALVYWADAIRDGKKTKK